MAIMKKAYAGKSVVANLILEELLTEWDNCVTNLAAGYAMSVTSKRSRPNVD